MTDKDKAKIIEATKDIINDLEMMQWIFNTEHAGVRSDEQYKKSLTNYISSIELQVQLLKDHITTL